MINSIRKTWLDKIKLPILVSAAFALFLSGGMPAGLTSKSVSAAGLSGSKHPSVIYTSPENRSRGILLNSKVSVTFNEAMDRNAFTPVSSYMKGPDANASPSPPTAFARRRSTHSAKGCLKGTS